MKTGCVLAEGPLDCGLAALATVADHFGLPCSVEALRELVETGPSGISLLGLRDAARVVGLDAKGFQASPESLGEIPLPAIAHLHAGHFVVLHEVRPDAVLVADPSTGLRLLPRGPFGQAWSGFGLGFEATSRRRVDPRMRASGRAHWATWEGGGGGGLRGLAALAATWAVIRLAGISLARPSGSLEGSAIAYASILLASAIGALLADRWSERAWSRALTRGLHEDIAALAGAPRQFLEKRDPRDTARLMGEAARESRAVLVERERSVGTATLLAGLLAAAVAAHPIAAILVGAAGFSSAVIGWLERRSTGGAYTRTRSLARVVAGESMRWIAAAPRWAGVPLEFGREVLARRLLPLLENDRVHARERSRLRLARRVVGVVFVASWLLIAARGGTPAGAAEGFLLLLAAVGAGELRLPPSRVDPMQSLDELIRVARSEPPVPLPDRSIAGRSCAAPPGVTLRSAVVESRGGRSGPRRFDLAFPPGRRTAILADRRSERAALLEAIAGIRTPVSGTVEIDGEPPVDPRAAGPRSAMLLSRDGWLPPLLLGQVLAGPSYVRALEVSGLHEEVSTRPWILETACDELDEGCRWRLQVALVASRAPWLVLVDEWFDESPAHEEAWRTLFDASGNATLLAGIPSERLLPSFHSVLRLEGPRCTLDRVPPGEGRDDPPLGR